MGRRDLAGIMLKCSRFRFKMCFEKGGIQNINKADEDKVFFAMVFLGKGFKKLLRYSDNNLSCITREERKPFLSTGFVPVPILSFILLKKGQYFGKNNTAMLGCSLLGSFLGKT